MRAADPAGLADAFEAAPFGYAILTASGRILGANERLSRYLGVRPADLAGRQIGEVLTLPARLFYEMRLRPLLLIENCCEEVALDFVAGDGAPVHALVNISVSRDAAGSVAGLRMGVMKASDRRNFERELLDARRALEERNGELRSANLSLQASNAQLDEANARLRELYAEAKAARAAAENADRLKTAFLANVSHEIRTPLNGVMGMAALLHDSLTDPKRRRMAQVIRESGDLLLHMLNDLLDLSKLQSGNVAVEAIPFIPAAVARTVRDVHATRAAAKDVALTLYLGDGAERAFLGDPLRITQILHNIVGNAVKFTERGAVAVSVGADPAGMLTITVSDTGIGMTAEQVERMFDPFVQAETSIARRFGGTGLGMAIVKSLLGLMHGDIDVDSALGCGTTIRVRLPLRPAEAAAAPLPCGATDVAASTPGAAGDALTAR